MCKKEDDFGVVYRNFNYLGIRFFSGLDIINYIDNLASFNVCYYMQYFLGRCCRLDVDFYVYKVNNFLNE